MEALPSLLNLFLGGNLLTGFSESGFWSTSLKNVDLSRNNLDGRIPDRVAQMHNLETLNLSWNTLRGHIPSGLGNVFKLDLSNNMLSGSIPQDLGNDNSVVDLSANQLSGSIPTNLMGCFSLNLSGNFIVGKIPGVVPLVPSNGYSEYFAALDLSNNLLDGPFPIWQSFGHLSLGRNRLSGDIIDYLTMVVTNHTWVSPLWLEIRLQGNRFTGDIATLFRGLRVSQSDGVGSTFFGVLDLSYNRLNMTLPTADDSNPLQAMLEDPHTYGLAELRLAGNNLKGISLPKTLKRSLPSLRILDLSDCFLEGEIPDELFNFTSLGNLTQLSVSMNRLSGGIPTKLPRSLQVLEIGGNNLEGGISSGIFTGLPNLLVFNASNNGLGGSIDFLATLPRGLQVLDLSGNLFWGEVQAELFFRLPNLTVVYVSNNPELCGGPFPELFSRKITGTLPHCLRLRWAVMPLILVVTAALLVSMASCFLLAWKWRGYSKKHEQDADLIAIVLKRALAVTLMPLRDLQRATNNFAEGSQIGEGGGGTVYLGELKDGTKVAIKMCKHREGREGFAQDKQQFLNEVEILSRVHHRHLVKLLGCSMESSKAALVFEYVPNGTLEEHIRGRREGALSWKQRLLIALQTSDALAYLHSAVDPPIFHTDVKSSNTFWTNTIGYMDPEYYNTFQLTAKSDFYSFGVVLLEVIFAKSPRDILWHSGEASLEDLAFSVMRNGDWERLIDPCLLDTFNTPAGEASIHSTCALAAQCLPRTSPERPEMKEVRKQLQTIWVQYEASLYDETILPSDIEEPEGAQDYSSDDRSSLLDLDCSKFSPSRTQCGRTGASDSDSVSEMASFAESDPEKWYSFSVE